MSMREPFEQLVLDLLTDSWDTSNTFDEMPSITYGWYDDPPKKPYVNVLQPQEDAIGGGDTGFDGMSPTGGTPVQTLGVVLPVHVFAASDELDNATTTHPREYLTGSADRSTGDVTGGAVGEIRRIVEANPVRPTNPQTGNEPAQLLSWRHSRPVPEPDEKGVYHYAVELNLLYTTA